MQTLKHFIEKTEADFGIVIAHLEGYSAEVLLFTGDLKAALANPDVQQAIVLILGPRSGAFLNLAGKVIVTAIDVLTINADVKAVTAPADKIRVFMADLQKYDPAFQDAILVKLAALIVCGLDNKTLKQKIYDTYIQLKAAGH